MTTHISLLRANDVLNDVAFMDPRIPSLLEDFCREVFPHRRFFAHLDFVVSPHLEDHVDDIPIQLQVLWATPDVPPMRLTYNTRDYGLRPLIT